jgi:hypothetical protein
MAKSKYGFSAMQIGEKKTFPLELWDKLRISAHQHGRYYKRKYGTNRQGDIIVVTRYS